MYAEESAGLHDKYSHRELRLNYELRKIFIKNNAAVLTGFDTHKMEDVGKGTINLEKIMEKTNEII